MKLIHIHWPTDSGENIAACQSDFHPDMLVLYEEMGIIDLEDGCVRYEDLHRLHKILRLKQNCGVNTIGATIIVDLLEKIENLQNELERLSRK